MGSKGLGSKDLGGMGQHMALEHSCFPWNPWSPCFPWSPYPCRKENQALVQVLVGSKEGSMVGRLEPQDMVEDQIQKILPSFLPCPFRKKIQKNRHHMGKEGSMVGSMEGTLEALEALG